MVAAVVAVLIRIAVATAIVVRVGGWYVKKATHGPYLLTVLESFAFLFNFRRSAIVEVVPHGLAIVKESYERVVAGHREERDVDIVAHHAR